MSAKTQVYCGANTGKVVIRYMTNFPSYERTYSKQCNRLTTGGRCIYSTEDNCAENTSNMLLTDRYLHLSTNRPASMAYKRKRNP